MAYANCSNQLNWYVGMVYMYLRSRENGDMHIGTLFCVFLVKTKVSVQGVKSLGGHFACLCWGFEFYEVKKIVIIFLKENGNTYTLLIIIIVKSLQKEQNSTNLLQALLL